MTPSRSPTGPGPRGCGAPGVLAARFRAQLLAGARPPSAADAVRRVGSLQAQDPRSLRLALRARTSGTVLADVEAALAQDLVVTWLMRGTLHVVPVQDVRWLLELGPPRSAGRARRLALGLDDARLDRLLGALPALLAGGPLTRAEIAAEVGLGPGQAVPHLLVVAAREGLLCRGPDRDGEPTYALLDDRVPPTGPVDRAEALVRLARRYLDGHGPADAADLAAWSGLPLRDARAGLAALGRPASAAADPDGAERTVRLVPAYDEYLLGYRGRDLAVDPAYARRIQAGGGVVSPAVLRGGRIVGRWSQRRQGDRLAVTVQAFGRLPAGVREGIEAEVADLGRFLGVRAGLRALDHLGPN